MLKPMLLSATACASCVRGTMSPTDACQAGALNAAPQPIRKVKVSSSQGDIQPTQVNNASASDTISMNACAASMILRRSCPSASAPPTSDHSRMGSAMAVWTSATMSAELAMEVISQAAPTDWIRLPKFDARLAIHTFRKIGVWNGEDDSRVSIPAKA